MSTNRCSSEVRTSVVVGSLAGSGNQRMYSRTEMLGAILVGVGIKFANLKSRSEDDKAVARCTRTNLKQIIGKLVHS